MFRCCVVARTQCREQEQKERKSAWGVPPHRRPVVGNHCGCHYYLPPPAAGAVPSSSSSPQFEHATYVCGARVLLRGIGWRLARLCTLRRVGHEVPPGLLPLVPRKFEGAIRYWPPKHPEMFTGVAVWHCPAGQASQPGLPPGVSRNDGGDGAATDASGFPRRCRGWALRLPTVLIRHDPSARCVCRLHSLAGRELRRWLHRSLELPRASCAVALPSHLLITPPDLPSAAFPDQERARACGAPTPRVP